MEAINSLLEQTVTARGVRGQELLDCKALITFLCFSNLLNSVTPRHLGAFKSLSLCQDPQSNKDSLVGIARSQGAPAETITLCGAATGMTHPLLVPEVTGTGERKRRRSGMTNRCL